MNIFFRVRRISPQHFLSKMSQCKEGQYPFLKLRCTSVAGAPYSGPEGEKASHANV
jgi:hypothetical protein